MVNGRFGYFFLVLLAVITPVCSGEIYVFLGPGGHRIISDKWVHRPGYQLISEVKSIKNMGKVLADNPDAETYRQRMSRYDGYIRKASRKHNLDPALVKAVIKAESDFNPFALSHKGAQGLMQLMPRTAEQYQVTNPYDPSDNISGGTRHLAYLMGRYSNNLKLALAAYNAGEKSVKKHSGIPPFSETRDYIKKVQRYYKFYFRSL